MPTLSSCFARATLVTVLSSRLFGQVDPAEWRDYALNHEGGAEWGRELFDGKATCSQCHTLDGSGTKAGPDLSNVGDKFSRAELIRAIQDPSANLAVGYATTLLTLKSGATSGGILKQATAEWLELMGPDGKVTRVPVSEIDHREESKVSLMPPGLHAALTKEDFANLIACLVSQRQTLKPGEVVSGMMDEVPRAAKPAAFVPFFSEESRFKEPLWFGEVPGQSDTFVVLTHEGAAWLVHKSGATETRSILLDLRGKVRVGGATGLLGMAFHPDFTKNRRYFLQYQILEDDRISTLVTERTFSEDFSKDSGEPPREILRIPAATQDHNGGGLAFGPDGYLYFGMGDTGPQGDPQGHGQDPMELRGKMLRIDVDHRTGDLAYAIPPDNPFVGKSDVRPEIWAIGFREPWRYSFDPVTKDLWVGDVGQNRFEEVAIVRAGENHGWNVVEGFNAHSDRWAKAGAVLTPPIASYPHRIGASVTGGYVCRGPNAGALDGWYVFADHETRRVWALTQKDRKLERILEIGRAPSRAVSFGQTQDGRLFLCGFEDGRIYQVDLTKVDPTPLITRTLLATAERNPVDWHWTTEQPVEGWMQPEFDDKSWTVSSAGFGTRDAPGSVVRTDWRSRDLWIRREFEVKELPGRETESLALRIHHDEDAEVYLNGQEIARLDRWTTGYVDLPLTPAARQFLKTGRNVLALHCRQNTGGQYLDAGLVELVKPESK